MSKSQDELDREAAETFSDDAWLSPEHEYCPEGLISYDDFTAFLKAGFLAGIQHERARLQAEIESLKRTIGRENQRNVVADKCLLQMQNAAIDLTNQLKETKARHAAEIKELVEALEFASVIAENGHIDETFAKYADKLIAKFKGEGRCEK